MFAFGILHLLGVAMLTAPILRRLPLAGGGSSCCGRCSNARTLAGFRLDPLASAVWRHAACIHNP